MIHLILIPVIERYVEMPLNELLVAGSEGDNLGEDVELSDSEASAEAEGDSAEDGGNLVQLADSGDYGGRWRQPWVAGG